MNGCERVSMHLLPSPPPPSLFPSAVYDIVMNLRLTHPPPLPKHVTTQMNNKRTCYQEEYNERVHLLTLPSPPFLCCTSLLFSSRLFSSLLVSSCALLSCVVRVRIQRGHKWREGEQGRSKRMKRKEKGREGKGRERKRREGKGREHTMRWDRRSDFSEWLCTPVGRMSLSEKVWSPKIK